MCMRRRVRRSAICSLLYSLLYKNLSKTALGCSELWSQKSHYTLKHLLFDRWPKIYMWNFCFCTYAKMLYEQWTLDCSSHAWCDECAFLPPATSVSPCSRLQQMTWVKLSTSISYVLLHGENKTSQKESLMTQTYGSTIDNAQCTYGARMERITFILCIIFVCLPRLHGVGWQSDSRTTPMFKGFSSHWFIEKKLLEDPQPLQL